jgi:hypothetical protein
MRRNGGVVKREQRVVLGRRFLVEDVERGGRDGGAWGAGRATSPSRLSASGPQWYPLARRFVMSKSTSGPYAQFASSFSASQVLISDW